MVGSPLCRNRYQRNEITKRESFNGIWANNHPSFYQALESSLYLFQPCQTKREESHLSYRLLRS